MAANYSAINTANYTVGSHSQRSEEILTQHVCVKSGYHTNISCLFFTSHIIRSTSLQLEPKSLQYTNHFQDKCPKIINGKIKMCCALKGEKYD